MLAQHVASELRMRLWTLRSLTDRNTPRRLKIDLRQSGYNRLFCYNGYNGFYLFWPVYNGFLSYNGCVLLPSQCGVLMRTWKWVKYQVLGLLEGVFFVVVAHKCSKWLCASQNSAWHTRKKACEKKIRIFLEDVFQLFVQFRSVCTPKQIPIAPQILFSSMSKPYIIRYTLFTFTVTVRLSLRYCQWQKRRYMHNRVRKKQNLFKQPCQPLSTNSELLPASAYNSSIRCVLRRSILTSSASIILRLKASDCFFLGAIWGVEQD